MQIRYAKSFIPTTGTAFICCFFMALCSCSKPGKQTSEGADTLKTDTVAARVDTEDEEIDDSPIEEYEPVEQTNWDDSVKKYFTAGQVAEIQNGAGEYSEIKSASDLAHFYLITLPAVEDMVNKQIEATYGGLMAGDDAPKASWEWFAEYFPCIGLDVLCSECSYEPMTTVGGLVNKARETPEKEDDLFFDMAASIYGSSFDGRGRSIGNTGGWYTLVDCDFCLASLVGSGQYFNVLQQLEKAKSSRALFGEVMDTYRTSVLGVTEEHYFYEKSKVLAEINQMLNSKLLTTEEASSMREARDNIQSGKSASQFNCGAARCDFGDVN